MLEYIVNVCLWGRGQDGFNATYKGGMYCCLTHSNNDAGILFDHGMMLQCWFGSVDIGGSLFVR